MLIVVVGATGTGKSALSLDIAEGIAAARARADGSPVPGSPVPGSPVHATAEPGTPAPEPTHPLAAEPTHPLAAEPTHPLAAEIVNADAMQFYRGMDIGTAKVPLAERRGIPHHLLDVLDVGHEASVADFQREARAAITEIEARGRTPILVGGSGLYVSSVIYNFEFPGTDPVARQRLETELTERGPGLLFQRLAELDPAAAASIGPHNGRRIVRALEVIELTGEPFGAGLPSEENFWCPTVVIGLQSPREQLVHRLEKRVEQMWADGLVAEAASLDSLGVTAARAIGYAQALDQLAGESSEAEAIEQAAILTRRYARRQVGWFRRYPGVTWIDADDPLRVEKALGAVGLQHE